MIQIISYTGSDRNNRAEELRRAFAACFGSHVKMPQMQKTAKGKPYFITAEDEPQIFMSITDSGPWRMIAFSDSEIGIDLQLCRMHGAGSEEDNWRKCMAIAKRFFHPAEYAWICGGKTPLYDSDRTGLNREVLFNDLDRSGTDGEAFSNDEEKCIRVQIRRFFRIWTALEAYVKFTGNGFDGSFSSFDVLHDFPELRFDYPETYEGNMLCVCHRNAEHIALKELPVPVNVSTAVPSSDKRI